MFLPNTNKKSNAKNNNVSVPLVLKRKKNRYSYELCKKSNCFIKTNNNNKKKSETINSYKHNFRNLLTKKEIDTWSNLTKKQIQSNINKKLCVELIGFDSD